MSNKAEHTQMIIFFEETLQSILLLLLWRVHVVLWWILGSIEALCTCGNWSSQEISPSSFWLPCKTLRRVRLTSHLTVHTDFIIRWLWTQSVASERRCHFTMDYQLPKTPLNSVSHMSPILQ